MTLTPMSDMTSQATRTFTCADCPASIVQQGTQVGEQGMVWHPHRCPTCSEKRLREFEAEQKTDRRQTDRVVTARRQETALTDLGVPPLYQGVSLESFELHGSQLDRDTQALVVRMGRRYMGNWPDVVGDLLILRGGPGTGKGHWAYSVAKGVAAMGAAVRVVKLADLVRRLRSSWGKEEGEQESAVLAFYRGLDLLVIDEVSRHAFYGQSIHQHLYDVLDHRIEYRRPTILTTNEDDAGLESILRPALLDRVQLHGGILEFGGASYRARLRLQEPA